MRDVEDVIEQDHRTIRALFQRFRESGDADAVRLICTELRNHALLEEQYLYPVLQRFDASLAKRARREHKLAKRLVRRIEHHRIGDPGLGHLVDSLERSVVAHIAEEEQEIFAILRVLSPRLRQELATALVRHQRPSVAAVGLELEALDQRLADLLAEQPEPPEPELEPEIIVATSASDVQEALAEAT